MPRIARELADKQVAKLAKGAPGRYAVGGCRGLLLQVTDSGSASWVLRILLQNGRRIDRGLGSYAEVSLADAREQGRELRKKLLESPHGDPVEHRRQARVRARAEREAADHAAKITFAQDAAEVHARKAQEFKNAKHAAQWLSSLKEHASPIWDKPVADVTRDDVLTLLKPIWGTKTETATRVRQRIESVFAFAIVMGHRETENPARWDGALELLLPNPSKLKTVKHHPALPWKRLPEFMAELRDKDTPSAVALELTILTAARSSEVRLATWSEFDLDAGLWTAPAEHMKSKLAHKVPLSSRAMELLKSLPKGKPDALVFPSAAGKPLSDMALSKLMKDMHEANVKRGGSGYMDPHVNRIATPHGTARSSFKDYCREQLGTKYQDEVSELALAHVNDDKTRAAYARGELLEQRAALMRDWCEFLA